LPSTLAPKQRRKGRRGRDSMISKDTNRPPLSLAVRASVCPILSRPPPGSRSQGHRARRGYVGVVLRTHYPHPDPTNRIPGRLPRSAVVALLCGVGHPPETCLHRAADAHFATVGDEPRALVRENDIAQCAWAAGH
jgi:hypothetical protein